jgi:hypothetical protein
MQNNHQIHRYTSYEWNKKSAISMLSVLYQNQDIPEILHQPSLLLLSMFQYRGSSLVSIHDIEYPLRYLSVPGEYEREQHQ